MRDLELAKKLAPKHAYRLSLSNMPTHIGKGLYASLECSQHVEQ